jgi:hypothetical protein
MPWKTYSARVRKPEATDFRECVACFPENKLSRIRIRVLDAGLLFTSTRCRLPHDVILLKKIILRGPCAHEKDTVTRR